VAFGVDPSSGLEQHSRSTGAQNNPKSTLLTDWGLSRNLWAVHNVAMSFGPVEIFLILVGVGLVAYALWRLLIRPRRIRPPRR
jgi:hypothetical protein